MAFHTNGVKTKYMVLHTKEGDSNLYIINEIEVNSNWWIDVALNNTIINILNMTKLKNKHSVFIETQYTICTFDES